MTVARLVALLFVGTAVASAFIAPWPTVRNGWAWLTGDPTVYALGHGYEEWSQRVLWLGLFAILAAIVGTVNLWLGATALLVGIHGALFDAGGPSSVWIALVLVGVVCLARAPQTHRLIVRVLVGFALVQAAYVIGQWWGIDPLRGSAQAFAAKGQAVGTLGNRTQTGVLLAILAPLLPWPSFTSKAWGGVARDALRLAGVALVVAAVLVSHSMGACLALGAAFAWKVRRSLIGTLTPLCGAIVVLWWLASTRGLDTLWLRLRAYWLGLEDWLTGAPVAGHGLGAWAQRLPAASVTDGSGGVWNPAHSDLLQWAYELGVPGAVLLLGFVAAQRRMILRPCVGAALVALLLVSAVEFPFRAVTTALTGATLLGIGLSSSSPSTGA